jgi:hypothetical protein
MYTKVQIIIVINSQKLINVRIKNQYLMNIILVLEIIS